MRKLTRSARALLFAILWAALSGASEEFARRLKSDYEKYDTLIRLTGAKIG